MDYRKLDCFPVENFVYEEVVEHSNIITAQGHAFVPFGIANEHNINFTVVRECDDGGAFA